jgi:thiamine biosynthesis lipoprotein
MHYARRLAPAALAVFASLAVLSCSESEAPEATRLTFNAMDTFVMIELRAPDAAELGADAADEIARIEGLLSRFDPESDISRINAATVGEAVSVSPETIAVLQKAAEVSRLSGGAFDVTVGPLIKLWKAAGKAGRMPADEDLAAARALVSHDAIEINAEANTVVKKIDGLSVNLGALAKGYGADRAAKVMRAGDAEAGFVDAGGDGFFFGLNGSGKPWRVGIRDPRPDRKTELTDVVGISDMAVVTSGDYERFVIIDGKRLSHIIDPRTGMSADGPDSVTVIAADAITADAWATALSVLGEKGADAARKADVEYLMYYVEGEGLRTVESPGFAAYRANE